VRAQQGQEGELEFILAWDGTDDLDLLVTCPSGEQIWAREMRACGGTLDIDANGSRNPKTTTPVEHVTFPGSAPHGSYEVAVANCELIGTRPPRPFRVRVLWRGQEIETVRGTAPTDRLGLGLGEGCGSQRHVVTVDIPPRGR
jgi:hypothetical protein